MAPHVRRATFKDPGTLWFLSQQLESYCCRCRHNGPVGANKKTVTLMARATTFYRSHQNFKFCAATENSHRQSGVCKVVSNSSHYIVVMLVSQSTTDPRLRELSRNLETFMQFLRPRVLTNEDTGVYIHTFGCTLHVLTVPLSLSPLACEQAGGVYAATGVKSIATLGTRGTSAASKQGSVATGSNQQEHPVLLTITTTARREEAKEHGLRKNTN